MKNMLKTTLALAALALAAAPALASGPETGAEHRPTVTPPNSGADNRGTDNRGTDNRGTDNPGTDNRGTDNPGKGNRGTGNRGVDNRPANTPLAPAAPRALGRVCATKGASRSNANDPEPGTPFSRCVKALAQSIKTACKGETKSNANDPERGTPFSRCVSDLAKGLRTSRATSDRGLARSACKRPDFDSGREYGACVRGIARAL